VEHGHHAPAAALEHAVQLAQRMQLIGGLEQVDHVAARELGEFLVVEREPPGEVADAEIPGGALAAAHLQRRLEEVDAHDPSAAFQQRLRHVAGAGAGVEDPLAWLRVEQLDVAREHGAIVGRLVGLVVDREVAPPEPLGAVLLGGGLLGLDVRGGDGLGGCVHGWVPSWP
jgi:hypothetical protein